MVNIFWTGYSNEIRTTAIPEIQHLISKYGDVVDFKLFSDIAITMIIEIKELKIDPLYEELSNLIGMDQSEYLNSFSSKERSVYLNITFAKGSGKLTIETPSVPG